MSLGALAGLELVVVLAFLVEAVTGFGATVIAVALGSFFVPVAGLIPAFVPVNLLLSIFVAARDRGHVDVRLLAGRILPAMLCGIPPGMYLFTLLGRHSGAVEVAFGAFVVILAVARLIGLARRSNPPALSTPAALTTLGAAGLIHGAFGTGGPLVILFLSRLGLDKSTFRATLAALWMTLSVPLLVGFWVQGRLGPESAALSLRLLPALALGLGVGQALHHRVQPDSFLRLVYLLLAVAGLFLCARALTHP